MKNRFTYLPIIGCLGVFILLGVNSRAATKTWNIAGGGAWTTAANWSPAAVPAVGDDVVFNNGLTYTVTAVPAINLNSITVTSSTTLTLSGGGLTLTINSAGTGITVNNGSTLTCGTAANKISLTVQGNITNNGTFSGTGASLQFTGVSNSTIGGTASTLAATVFNYTNISLNKPVTAPSPLMNFNIPVTCVGTVTAANGAGALSSSYYEVDANFSITGTLTLSNNGNMRFNTGTLTCTGVCSFSPTSPNIATLTLTSGETAANFGGNVTLFAGTGTKTFYDSLSAGGNTNIITGSVLISATASLYMVTNHTMSVGGNWTNNGTFNTFPLGVGVGTVTLNGAAVQTIGGTSSTTFNNLTINNSSGISKGVTLSDLSDSLPKYVSGVFTLTNGKLISYTNNLLTLNSNATVSGGSNSSYVDGPMAKVIADNTASTFMFPVGKDSAGNYNEYLPIGMTGFSGLGTNVTFTAELIKKNIDAVYTPYNNSNHPDAWITNVDSCEYWTLTRSAINLSSQIVLSWNNSFCVVGSPGNLRVLTINGSNWNDLDTYPGQNPTYAGGSTGTVTSYNASSYYTAFTLGSDSIYINPLPITLLSFTATPLHNNVLVQWSTASELNNASYTVEKEVAGSSNSNLQSFVPIAKIAGAGNSTTTHHYEIIDDSPLKAKQWWNYYRLKQTDFDGESVYYGPIAVHLVPSMEIGIYPTVSSGLFYYTGNWQNADVTVYSTDGRKVFHANITNEVSALDLTQLPQGLYFVSIQTNDGIAESRLIKTSEK